MLETLPPTPHLGCQNRFLSIGYAALTVRWGSYLAALCEPAFPLYAPDVANIPDAQDRAFSVIADEERHRMNI